ncbi:hypothetical protein VaNZ11_015978, partial [Volvox africanus]
MADVAGGSGSAVSTAGAGVPLESVLFMAGGSGGGGGGGGGGSGAHLLNSGQLRNASLRHYLQDGSHGGPGGIASAAAAAAVLAAAASSGGSVRSVGASGGGGGGGGDSGQLPVELSSLYMSTGSNRIPSTSLMRGRQGRDVGVNASAEGSVKQRSRPPPAVQMLQQVQQVQQVRQVQQEKELQLQQPPLPTACAPNSRYVSAGYSNFDTNDRRQPLSVSSFSGGRADDNRFGASGSGGDDTGTVGEERKSVEDLLAQLQQQIAELRRLKENSSRSGAAAATAVHANTGHASGGGGGSGSDPYQHDHQQQQQQPTAAAMGMDNQEITNKGGGGASDSLAAPRALRNLRSRTQQEFRQKQQPQQPQQRLSPSQPGYRPQQQQTPQQKLSGSQSGHVMLSGVPQQQVLQARLVGGTSELSGSQASVRPTYRSTGTTPDGSSSDAATNSTAGMLVISENLVDGKFGAAAHRAAAAAADAGDGGGGAGDIGTHPISLSAGTSTRTSPNGSTSLSPLARIGRGTSRLKLLNSTYGFRTGTGSGTGSGDSADAVAEELVRGSRGASFSLSRISPRVMLSSFESFGGVRTSKPGGGGGGGGGALTGLGARVKSSKAVLSGRASMAW